MSRGTSILLIFILILFFNRLVAQDYFEGEVTFEVDYESWDFFYPVEFLNQNLGNKMVGTIKEDRYSVHYYADEKLQLTSFYFLEKGISLTKYAAVDTIYKAYIDDGPGELLSFKRNRVNKKKILGEYCESVSIKFKPDYTDFCEEVLAVYYFNPKYKLNPKYYENHLENFWNLFIAETGATNLYSEVVYKDKYKSRMIAVEIKERKVSNEEFIFEKNYPIVDLGQR